MKRLTIWFLGTTYVLAVLAGTGAIVWAADHKDNSADPTHWALGAVIVMAPAAMFGVFLLGRTWSRTRAVDRRVWIGFGVVVVAALIVGVQEMVADASACGDDDCVRLAVPIALACVLGAWSLPLGLSMLRRVQFPAPLLSAGLFAVLITLVAALAAAVQATRQEDDFADLRLGVILLIWMLPALPALAAMVRLRGPMGAAAQRNAGGRTAAGYLVAVGCWFVAMPFAAGVDSDSLAVLLALGLVALVSRSRAGA